MIIRFILIFILNLYGLCAFAATAQPTSIGLMIFTQGQVIAIDQTGQQRALQRKSEIYLHDKIITQTNSKAQIKLQDDSIIVLQPSSEFYISNFSFNKWSPHTNKYVGNIIKGALINISGQGRAENYQLRSPLTTIAFRGTGLATRINIKNNLPFNQEIYVFQGYVTVQNKCKNAAEACKPYSIDIGVGQNINSAIINFNGKLQGTETSSLLKEIGVASANKILTRSDGGGGGIIIKCKAQL
jgi:hypothetical protein